MIWLTLGRVHAHTDTRAQTHTCTHACTHARTHAYTPILQIAVTSSIAGSTATSLFGPFELLKSLAMVEAPASQGAAAAMSPLRRELHIGVDVRALLR